MTPVTALVYLVTLAVAALFSGRVLAYLLRHLVPRLLPRKWGKVKVELRSLELLRARGVEMKTEKSVAQSVRLDDVCLFREAEWYRTWLRWIVERSFPIGLRRLEVHLNLKALLEQTHEESSTTTVKVKRRRKIRIATWMWRLLFQLLSRILVNVADVQIFLEDVGLKVGLEHLAVLFKCENDVPFRAALKAKNLTCTMMQSRGEPFHFVELSEVAATASVECKKNMNPELHSLKVVLGTVGVTVNNQLIEKMIEIIKSLPPKLSTPRVKSLKKEAKPQKLLPTLPAKIGGVLHKLSVSYEDGGTSEGLRSKLELSSVHVGMESSATEEWLDVEGGIQKLQLQAGMTSESIEAVKLKLPDAKFTCRLENRNERLSVHSKGEMGSIRAAVDDDLIWHFMTSLHEHLAVWGFLSTVPSEEHFFGNLDDNMQLNQSASTNEMLSVWSEEPVKDSADLDAIYRKCLDPEDLGMIEEAEEEESVEEIAEVVMDEAPSPKKKEPLLAKVFQMEMDVTIGVKECIEVVISKGHDRGPLITVASQDIDANFQLTPSSPLNACCVMDAKIRNASLRAVLEGDSMTELVTVEEIGCSGEALCVVEGSQRASIEVSCHPSAKGVMVSLGTSKLTSVLHVAAGMHTTAKEYFSSAPKNSRKGDRPRKPKSVAVKVAKWIGVVSDVRVLYDMELHPVKEHCTSELKPIPCSLSLWLTKFDFQSGNDMTDCRVKVQGVTVGWSEAEKPFLDVTGLKCDVFKQQPATVVEIESYRVKMEAEVDLVLLGLQLAEDAMHLKTQAQSKLNLGVPRSRTSRPVKALSFSSSTVKGVAVRVPSFARLSMQHLHVNVAVSEIVAEMRIAESDVLTLRVTEATVVKRRTAPVMSAKELELQMNERTVVECDGLHLKVKGPCFLSELRSEPSGSPKQRRDSTQSLREVQMDLSSSAATMEHSGSFSDEHLSSPHQSEMTERRIQMQKWSSMGCSSMGIAEFVEEDCFLGGVLDFFSVDLEMERAAVILPHDQNIGRLILFAELWTEAVKDLVKIKIKEIKGIKKRRPMEALREGPADLIEICISAKKVLFRLDAHPMEAWLGLHATPLKETATLKWAWDSLIQNLHHDFPDENDIMFAADRVSRGVMADYKESIKDLRTIEKDPMFHHGAWMCVTAEDVHALVLVGDRKSPTIVGATVQKIKELDKPTSDDISFDRVQPIYIAAAASNIAGNFCGVRKPSATVERVDFNGMITRGRQLTHKPAMHTVSYKVGKWHAVDKQHPIKGARPPTKVYTDMAARLIRLDANGGIGLEPVFCELSKAFTRLIPPSQVNSDGSLPAFSGHTLQSWDKIRYTWRGKMDVEIHHLAAAVAADISTFVDIQTPRLEVQADRLTANVVAGGVDVTAVNFDITLFEQGLRAAPEAPLHDLPLCMWPHASIQIRYTWLMPQGRSPLLHHAFPVVQSADPEIRLDPVDLFELFVGEGYTLGIHADFDPGRSASDPDPKIIMGEAQVRFLVQFFQLMESAPLRIRGCWKRGTYFMKKDKRKKCITPELASLLHRIVVSLKTSRLAVEHCVWETDDPSDRLLVTCDDVRFNGTWAFLNKIEDANALREGRFVKRPRYREIDGVWRYVKGKSQLPDMEDLAVSTRNVEGFLPETHTIHPVLAREAPEAQVDLASLGLFKDAAGAAAGSDGVKPPDGIKGKILTAMAFNLKQQRGKEKRPETSLEPDELQVLMPSGEIKRPLHIQLTDVKIIMPLEVRNAVVGVYMHMLSAFTGPPRSAKEKKITDCIPPEQLQERRQEEQDDEKEYKSTDSQLLRVLLQQDEEGRGPVAETKRHSSSGESQKVDPLPPASKRILQMEFENVQLSCLSSSSMGGTLVCLERGILHEYFSEEQQIRTMTLNLNQVQAYHVDTKIDPMNPVRWLDRVEGSLVIPADSHDILTRIVQPFEAELSDLHLMMLAQARNPGRAAEELKIHSSRIEANTTSEQFEMLVDVINSVATPPPPDIKLMKDTILGPTGSALEDTSEAIAEQKQVLRETYRGFNALRQEAHELSLLCYPHMTELMSLEQVSRSKALEFLMHVSKEGPLSCKKNIPFVQNILEEQIEMARKICYQSTSTLQEVRAHVASTNKHKRLYKSMNMQIAVENVTWRLLDKEGEFMLAEIKRVFFKSFRNKDLSGESNVSVYRIELRDTRGCVGPGSGLDSGVVLSVLEPTGSDEEVLRGLAIRGTQTSSHVYYEHIEAWVHRFGLNFNESVASSLAGFFFPTSDVEIVRKREEDWAKLGDPRRELEVESEASDHSLVRQDSMSATVDIRPRASSFLEPLLYSSLPDKDRRSSGSTAPMVSIESDPLQWSACTTPTRSRRRKRKGLYRPRKLHFVHVRFNKVVTHVTYVGRPFSFNGLTVTLGMSEYNTLEGSWRGLFKKYRNSAIGSVIKSIATHEGRSYDPSQVMLGHGTGEERRSGLLARGRQLFKKRDKSAAAAAAAKLMEEEEDEEEMNCDVMDEKAEQASRSLLLGKY